MKINQRCLDMLFNCNFEQKVVTPTRGDNILDIFMTNRPSLVSQCISQPGLGDHDIVKIKSSVKPRRVVKPPRKILPNWKLFEIHDSPD